MYLLIMIYMYPPLLVVSGSKYYRPGETPLVMATSYGHTQVVGFIKSRLPQGEYIVTVFSGLVALHTCSQSYIRTGLLRICSVTSLRGILIRVSTVYMFRHVVLWTISITTIVVIFSASMPKSSGGLMVRASD